MKNLVLMRHARTEHHNVGGDRARRLVPEGRAASVAAGRELAALGLQYALVSTATRTRETFEALGLDIPAEFQDAIYEGGIDTVMQRISEMEEGISNLLVVGHSPVIPSLAAHLTFAKNPSEADQLQCHFPTSTYSVFQIDGKWADFAYDGDLDVTMTQIQRP